MKKAITTLALFLLLLNGIIGQSCFPDGLKFHQQSDIDEFIANNPTCTSILGDLEINPISGEINNLDALEQITKIGGTLSLNSLSNVVSFEGLRNIDSIGGAFYLQKLPALENLKPFSNLKTIRGGFYIAYLNNLLTLDGLQKIEKLNSAFEIVYCDKLESLNGLNNLEIIYWNFKLLGNKKLTSFEGLDNLKYIYWLYLKETEAMLDFTGLESVTHLERGLSLYENLAFKSFKGLESLDTIQSRLSIKGNRQFESFEDFNPHIRPNTYFVIEENPNLSVCNQPFICEFLDSNFEEPTATIEISDNGDGCNSKEEILEQCQTSNTQTINNQSNITLYPNPTTGKIFFKGDNLQKAKITITDLTGRILLVEKLNGSNEIDLPSNTKGMLFVKIETEEGVAVKRVLKL